MPRYSFKNRETNDILVKEFSSEEMEKFLEENEEYHVIIRAPGIISGKRTNFSLDNNLKGVYDNIKRNYPGNKMDY